MNWYQLQGDSRTILLFGEGVPGQIRHTERVLYDAEAYEAAQGYQYLKELIHLRGDTKKRLWVEFLCIADLLSQLKSAEFCELGSTMFASIEKIAVAEAMCSFGLKIDLVEFVGIEPSEYFRQVAALAARYPIRQYETFEAVPSPRHPRVVYSHFVGNYAFASAEEYVAWLRPSEAIIVAESFSIDGGDVETSVLGKRSTLFDHTTFMSALFAAGFRLSPYQYRKVDLRGIPAIQVFVMACRDSVRIPNYVVEGCGLDPKVLEPATSTAVLAERFRSATAKVVEKPGGSGFRRKT
ncbi:MAG: hypothetical protein FJX59_05645 [Alphaproteobacteria bacterium]|nr:hypothetical protein [Alphaproteobacteria bacterium]